MANLFGIITEGGANTVATRPLKKCARCGIIPGGGWEKARGVRTNGGGGAKTV